MTRTAGKTKSNLRPLVMILLLTALALASPAGAVERSVTAAAIPLAPVTPTAWTPPTPSYRVLIDADGLYALDYNYLSAAGLPVDSINPRTFRMFYMGQEIAIRVEGEEDGIFGPGDAVLFYGRSADSLYYDGLLPTYKYTGTNVFWLSYGGPNGLRMTQRDGSGAGVTPPSFPHRNWLGREYYYLSAYPFEFDADHWYADTMSATGPAGSGPTASRSYYFDAANVYGGTALGTLKVDLLGYRAGPHHLKLYVNDNLVLDGSPTWFGFDAYTVQVDVPQAYLLDFWTNEVKVEIYVDPAWYLPSDPLNSKTADQIYINWADITYHDTFVAENNLLLFDNPDAGSWRYEVSGFEAADIEVYDVTDLRDVRYFTGTSISGAGPYTVGFGDVTEGRRRYLALTGSARLSSPTGISAVSYPASSYSRPDLLSASTSADYIIVTHRDFWTDAERLATLRARDFRVLLVDAQQVYDQFNGGLMSAEAIRDFLAHAHTRWTPPAMYVVLFGDGSSDIRNYRSSKPTFIPPYLYLADPDLGETAADNRFVTITGNDNVPDMHLGRLPANTAVQAQAIVDKIEAYERDCSCNSWNYNTLFVADDLEGGGGNFYDYSDEVAEGSFVDSLGQEKLFVPRPPYTVLKAYLGQTCDVVGNPKPATGCQNQIISTLNNQGALFVSYVGHSSKAVWADETLLSPTLMNQLNNGPCLPIMVPMTCFEGSYHDPSTDALAEVGLRMPVNGSIASWSPTGFGLVTGHDYLEKGLVLALLHEEIDRLGPATTYAKQYLVDNAPPGAYLDLLDTFGLLGDPGLRPKTDAVCRMPTGVRIAGLRAQPAPGGVLVSWETESEADMLGFRVLRKAAGEPDFVVASPELIFAAHSGAARGSAYTFLDRAALGPTAYLFVLEIVKVDGSSERYGRVEVNPGEARLYLPFVHARR